MTTASDDPAVAAWQRVRRVRRNDIEYLAAIVEFERAIPTTERGVILKRKLQRSRDRALAEGDKLTWRGCVHQARFARTIEQGLARLIVNADLGEEDGARSAPTPTPRHHPRRRRRKSVEGFS